MGISTSMFKRHLVTLELSQNNSRYGERTLCAMNVSMPNSVMDTFVAFGEPVLRRHHKRQMIREDDLRNQPVIVGIVADHAKFQIAVDQLGRDLARQAPPDLHFYLRISRRYCSMCCNRYSDVDSFAPMVSRPAELSRSSARAFCSSASRFSKRRAYSTHDPAGIGEDELIARTVDQLFPKIGF